MEKSLIIVAGGKGKRFGSQLPKQFLKVNGKPLILHTIQRFLTVFENIELIIVLPADYFALWNTLIEEYRFQFPHQLAEGGPDRFHSVKSGLKFVTHSGVVAVHDSVRPLVSAETIKDAFQDAENFGNAVPVIPVNESLRKVLDNENCPVDRSRYRIVQTPQVFKVAMLQDAYRQGYNEDFTDDASVVERAGHKIHLVEGTPENIKITKPADLLIAEELLKNLHF